MLIIKIRKNIVFITVVFFVSLSLGIVFYLKSNFYRKPLACQAEVRSHSEDKHIRKEYDVYFYINNKMRALILINGFYIVENEEVKTIRRIISFEPVWEGNHLMVENIVINKNINDDAPDDGIIPILANNDVLKFEMLTKHTYLISTVQSKMACNIRN